MQLIYRPVPPENGTRPAKKWFVTFCSWKFYHKYHGKKSPFKMHIRNPLYPCLRYLRDCPPGRRRPGP